MEQVEFYYVELLSLTEMKVTKVSIPVVLSFQLCICSISIHSLEIHSSLICSKFTT